MFTKDLQARQRRLLKEELDVINRWIKCYRCDDHACYLTDKYIDKLYPDYVYFWLPIEEDHIYIRADHITVDCNNESLAMIEGEQITCQSCQGAIRHDRAEVRSLYHKHTVGEDGKLQDDDVDIIS